MLIAGYQFSEPQSLSSIDLIDRAAIYVILCPNGNSNYTPVYVGETGQVSTRLSKHERASCWSQNCANNPYVAIMWTPTNQYTADDRLNIEKQIRLKYNPPCNRE